MTAGRRTGPDEGERASLPSERSGQSAQARLAVARPVRRDLRPRAYLAVHDQGVIWADEIFQTLEQGHRLALAMDSCPGNTSPGRAHGFCPG